MSLLIQEKNITILEAVSSWQDAIALSAKPLVDHGFVEEKYIAAMIDSTHKHGPYYVLAPEIAMPHASPMDGVMETQISLLLLRKPIRFRPDGYDVRLVFTLAATDNVTHLEMLRRLADLFADEKRIANIIHASTIDEIMSLLEYT